MVIRLRWSWSGDHDQRTLITRILIGDKISAHSNHSDFNRIPWSAHSDHSDFNGRQWSAHSDHSDFNRNWMVHCVTSSCVTAHLKFLSESIQCRGATVTTSHFIFTDKLQNYQFYIDNRCRTKLKMVITLAQRTGTDDKWQNSPYYDKERFISFNN